MKKDNAFATELLCEIASRMRHEAAREFLAAAAARDERAPDAACQKGDAARRTLLQQQGHTLPAGVACGLGLGPRPKLKIGSKPS